MSSFANYRNQFPALRLQIARRRAIYSMAQPTPQRIDAIADYLAKHNANNGGTRSTNRESDAIVEATATKLARCLGTHESVVFGPGHHQSTPA